MVGRGALVVDDLVVRPKEEQFVVIPVEGDFRKNHGSSERTARILEPVFGLCDSRGVVKELVRIEFLVAEVIVGSAVELRRAALDRDVELTAATGPVLGGIVAGEQPDFANGVGTRRLIGA